MKALVLFDSLFGNTERIAGCLAEGLREAGVEARCASIQNANVSGLAGYDLLAIGAPTQYLTASKPMKEFLERLKGVDLGAYGFAFDTKLDSPLSGSAAKFIEKKLQEAGLKIIRPRRSAMVAGQKGKQVALKTGMEELFRLVGKEIGAVLEEMPQKAGVA